MGRTVDIEIGGTTYTMCFTLWAFGQVCERYESLPKCTAELDRLVTEDEKGAMDAYLWLLHILLVAQWRRQTWGDGESEVPPDEENIADLVCPGDFVMIQRKVLEAISLGNSRTVGVQVPNGDGAGEKRPAPES